ncbi:helix-turn-helix transcriptional regulator [Sphingobium indicum]|nr:WYL domain-containing protein [Sphingobium indicum]
MAKLDRILRLAHLLAETVEGLTLDEIALEISVDRRTAERMRDVIRIHFDLEEVQDDRSKRFRIREGLRRIYTRPSAAEIAALQAEVEARRRDGSPNAEPLASLLTKVRSALDERERRRIDPDLDALARLQRTFVPAGPLVAAAPEALTTVQQAIMAGCCVEFEYVSNENDTPQWRRVVPCGLVHGPVTYLVGRMPGRDLPPVLYRLDRMSVVRMSNSAGLVPEDWDLDHWLAQSFGIWREEDHDIVLRVRPEAVERALSWRFHPVQQVEQRNDELVVSFRSGGLRELADHLFTWGGSVVIDGPQELRDMMHERLMLAAGACEQAATGSDVLACNQ